MEKNYSQPSDQEHESGSSIELLSAVLGKSASFVIEHEYGLDAREDEFLDLLVLRVR
jgi:hypothetical protein